MTCMFAYAHTRFRRDVSTQWEATPYVQLKFNGLRYQLEGYTVTRKLDDDDPKAQRALHYTSCF